MRAQSAQFILFASSIVPLAVAQTTETSRPALAEPQADSASLLAASARFAPRVDRTTLHFAHDAAGALWVRGANYKARFDTSGAAFIPFFGSRAPRNFDVAMTLSSATLAGDALELDPQAEAVRDGDVVSFERGGAREVFELALDGVEHEFVFDELAMRAELRVAVAFASELAPRADARGWRFENEYGHVHYGRATAIDAGGRSLALDGRLEDTADGARIEFVVPAQFVANAALPLVVDPWVASYTVENGAITSVQSDLAYDGSGSYAMHCWEEVFSAGDHDVYSAVYDQYGNQVASTPLYLDYTSAHWVRPRVAYMKVLDRYGFTAEVGPAGSRAIWGYVRGPYSFGFNSGQFQLSDPTSLGEKTNADVGGDPYGGPSWFLAVYERTYSSGDHDIHARRFDGNGVPTGTTIMVDDSPGTFDALPAVSRSNDTNIWNVAWQRTITASNRDIYGARVQWQGSVVAGTFPVAVSSLDDTNPSASSPQRGTSRYVIAHQRNFGPDHDIQLTFLDGTTVLQDLDLSVAEGNSYLNDQIQPAIECDGGHFTCAYSDNWGSGSTYLGVASEFAPSGNVLVLNQKHQLLSVSGYNETRIQIASPYASGYATSIPRYVTSWSVVGGGASNIAGALFDGSLGGPITSFCQGTVATCPCGNSAGIDGGCGHSQSPFGGLLSFYGSASTTTDTLTLTYSYLPANVSALLFQGVNANAGVPFGDGKRCVAGPVYRFPIRATNPGGYAQYGYGASDVPISVAGSIPSLGVAMNYQVWYRDSGAYCTSANTNFTNALTVYWVP